MQLRDWARGFEMLGVEVDRRFARSEMNKGHQMPLTLYWEQFAFDLHG